jgi:Flp pilus assembly protein protease CpaA
MRIAFFLLLIVHGLIHLMGFVKAFGLSEMKELTQPISKPLGILWLIVFLLFASVAVMYLFKYPYWWLFGLIAVFVSQTLIIYSWQDAKFGTIANAIILIVSVIGYGTWNF